jgi:trehalose synthase-fused probable maltokinase
MPTTLPSPTEAQLAAEARAAFTPRWLAGQRWFRSKQRAIDEVTLLDAVEIGGPAWLVVLGVRYVDGGLDRYLVVAHRSPRGMREAGDGEGAWRGLVARMAAGAELPGRDGSFRFDATPALAEILPTPRLAAEALEERRLRGEQTNTSVVLGERLILKLYRLLEPGPNPDVEVTAFLTDVGFAGTPALAGSMEYLIGDERSAAAMLQAYVPAAPDAWSDLLQRLAGDADAGLAGVRQIGEVTAALHAALASRPEEPDFPSRAATPAELAAWQSSAEGQLAASLSSVDGESRRRLEAVGPRVRERFAAIGATAGGRISRIHGDYHLGQLLRSGDDFVVIDFEGEPARPVAARRAPASPLKDVAGLLRSLDYAARMAAAADRAFDADRWLARARETFLGGYGGIDPDEQPLLDAFELEKACYEVRYEASNRPAWLWLPLAAVERLAAGA